MPDTPTSPDHVQPPDFFRPELPGPTQKIDRGAAIVSSARLDGGRPGQRQRAVWGAAAVRVTMESGNQELPIVEQGASVQPPAPPEVDPSPAGATDTELTVDGSSSSRAGERGSLGGQETDQTAARGDSRTSGNLGVLANDATVREVILKADDSSGESSEQEVQTQDQDEGGGSQSASEEIARGVTEHRPRADRAGTDAVQRPSIDEKLAEPDTGLHEPEPISSTGMATQVEYDAQPLNYRDLVTQLIQAREEGVPSEETAALEQRIDAASRLRIENAQQGSPITTEERLGLIYKIERAVQQSAPRHFIIESNRPDVGITGTTEELQAYNQEKSSHMHLPDNTIVNLPPSDLPPHFVAVDTPQEYKALLELAVQRNHRDNPNMSEGQAREIAQSMHDHEMGHARPALEAGLRVRYLVEFAHDADYPSTTGVFPATETTGVTTLDVYKRIVGGPMVGGPDGRSSGDHIALGHQHPDHSAESTSLPQSGADDPPKPPGGPPSPPMAEGPDPGDEGRSGADDHFNKDTIDPTLGLQRLEGGETHGHLAGPSEDDESSDQSESFVAPALLRASSVHEFLDVKPNQFSRLRPELFSLVLGDKTYRFPEPYLEAFNDWLARNEEARANPANARRFAAETSEAGAAIEVVKADFEQALGRLVVPDPTGSWAAVDAAGFAELVGVNEQTIDDWRRAGLDVKVHGWRGLRQIPLPTLREFIRWQYPRSYGQEDP